MMHSVLSFHHTQRALDLSLCTDGRYTLTCRKQIRMPRGDTMEGVLWGVGMGAFHNLSIFSNLCQINLQPKKRMCLLQHVSSKEFLVVLSDRLLPEALLYRNSRAPSVWFHNSFKGYRQSPCSKNKYSVDL